MSASARPSSTADPRILREMDRMFHEPSVGDLAAEVARLSDKIDRLVVALVPPQSGLITGAAAVTEFMRIKALHARDTGATTP